MLLHGSKTQQHDLISTFSPSLLLYFFSREQIFITTSNPFVRNKGLQQRSAGACALCCMLKLLRHFQFFHLYNFTIFMHSLAEISHIYKQYCPQPNKCDLDQTLQRHLLQMLQTPIVIHDDSVTNVLFHYSCLCSSSTQPSRLFVHQI